MPVAVVVLAHPNPGSFNHAIALSIASDLTDAGFEVRSHDLYAEGFDPIGSVRESDTSREPADLLADTQDELVRQHRDDLVAASTLAIVHPNWWGKPTAERERALFGDPLQLIWERCVSSYLGDPYFERRVIRTVSDPTPEVREDWLATVRRDADRIGRLP